MAKSIKTEGIIVMFVCPTKKRATEVHLYPDEIDHADGVVTVTCLECGKRHRVEVLPNG